jgi:hypothetical protein
MLIVGVAAVECRASAFVRGAYYRLGEDDPGAVAGGAGNDPTHDSFGDKLDLTRVGTTQYSGNVPAGWPDSKLSMAFNNFHGGPTVPGYYARATSLSMVEQGYAIEAWVNQAPPFDGPVTGGAAASPADSHLVAYNGDPDSNGFGLYEHAGNYVARLGTSETVLGPAGFGQWHHLAFIQTFANSSFYYDGKLVSSSDKGPAPLAASGGFFIGGRTANADLFDGWIDEVRYQSFNPIAAGGFDPTSFLIVPAPGSLALAGVAFAGFLLHRRRPHHAPLRTVMP